MIHDSHMNIGQRSKSGGHLTAIITVAKLTIINMIMYNKPVGDLLVLERSIILFFKLKCMLQVTLFSTF